MIKNTLKDTHILLILVQSEAVIPDVPINEKQLP